MQIWTTHCSSSRRRFHLQLYWIVLKIIYFVFHRPFEFFIQIGLDTGSRPQKSTQNTVRTFLVVMYCISIPFNVPCQQLSEHVFFFKLSKAGVTNWQPAYETVWKLSCMLQIRCASRSLCSLDSFLWGARVPYWNECKPLIWL